MLFSCELDRLVWNDTLMEVTVSDKPKSVLDVIGWCQELEQRLEKIEHSSGRIVASGQEKLKKDGLLMSPDGDKDRVVTIPIKFENEIEGVRKIIPSILAIDADSHANTRFDVYSENLTPAGFDLKISTWYDSKVHVIVISWIAIT